MDTKRLKIIADLFGDSKGFLPQAKLIKFDKKLSSIKTDELINFAIFADRFRGNFVNNDLVIHKALMFWHKKRLEEQARPGVKYFKNIEDMIAYCKEVYKNEELCSGKPGEGGNGFLEFVIIKMDSEGVLRNSFVVTDNGVYQRLDANETSIVYRYLFDNQHMIGKINRISEEWYTRLNHKAKTQEVEQEEVRQISPTTKKLLANLLATKVIK
ncbi:hypothetical protein [Campylobacter pinnipediorum]|uniref:hypothetical protein n=1 Tax=Campylobacter pinnipediorum TaxID=1965231 RepID=UPI00084D71B4|nr:hypothetical protein [Campylobacter pinnipediorum]AQW80775.1 hypothetical protein CPIN17260_0447 [Campylobacter pinnipediorum subsp. pinnipediorum]AQW83339.1 hypothetical protein CPIN17261_1341 [Campylobacter pinnipediorum subsp. pinnipediorum]OPA75418.1 hypothetical protein BFG05_05970 [Campylobacter pinnipediorum subsp. pinnipediorum]